NIPTGRTSQVLLQLLSSGYSPNYGLGNPPQAALTDPSYVNVWGASGELSPASEFLSQYPYSSFPIDEAAVEKSPVNQFTKALSGDIDNCDVPVLDSLVPSAVSPVERNLLGSGNVNQSP